MMKENKQICRPCTIYYTLCTAEVTIAQAILKVSSFTAHAARSALNVISFGANVVKHILNNDLNQFSKYIYHFC